MTAKRMDFQKRMQIAGKAMVMLPLALLTSAATQRKVRTTLGMKYGEAQERTKELMTLLGSKGHNCRLDENKLSVHVSFLEGEKVTITKEHPDDPLDDLRVELPKGECVFNITPYGALGTVTIRIENKHNRSDRVARIITECLESEKQPPIYKIANKGQIIELTSFAVPDNAMGTIDWLQEVATRIEQGTTFTVVRN